MPQNPISPDPPRWENLSPGFVCAECGHEQDSMDRRCDRCRGPRVVMLSTVEALFGSGWRDAFRPRTA